MGLTSNQLFFLGGTGELALFADDVQRLLHVMPPAGRPQVEQRTNEMFALLELSQKAATITAIIPGFPDVHSAGGVSPWLARLEAAATAHLSASAPLDRTAFTLGRAWAAVLRGGAVVYASCALAPAVQMNDAYRYGEGLIGHGLRGLEALGEPRLSGVCGRWANAARAIGAGAREAYAGRSPALLEGLRALHAGLVDPELASVLGAVQVASVGAAIAAPNDSIARWLAAFTEGDYKRAIEIGRDLVSGPCPLPILMAMPVAWQRAYGLQGIDAVVDKALAVQSEGERGRTLISTAAGRAHPGAPFLDAGIDASLALLASALGQDARGRPGNAQRWLIWKDDARHADSVLAKVAAAESAAASRIERGLLAAPPVTSAVAGAAPDLCARLGARADQLAAEKRELDARAVADLARTIAIAELPPAHGERNNAEQRLARLSAPAVDPAKLAAAAQASAAAPPPARVEAAPAAPMPRAIRFGLVESYSIGYASTRVAGHMSSFESLLSARAEAGTVLASAIDRLCVELDRRRPEVSSWIERVSLALLDRNLKTPRPPATAQECGGWLGAVDGAFASVMKDRASQKIDPKELEGLKMTDVLATSGHRVGIAVAALENGLGHRRRLASLLAVEPQNRMLRTRLDDGVPHLLQSVSSLRAAMTSNPGAIGIGKDAADVGRAMCAALESAIGEKPTTDPAELDSIMNALVDHARRFERTIASSTVRWLAEDQKSGRLNARGVARMALTFPTWSLAVDGDAALTRQFNGKTQALAFVEPDAKAKFGAALREGLPWELVPLLNDSIDELVFDDGGAVSLTLGRESIAVLRELAGPARVRAAITDWRSIGSDVIAAHEKLYVVRFGPEKKLSRVGLHGFTAVSVYTHPDHANRSMEDWKKKNVPSEIVAITPKDLFAEVSKLSDASGVMFDPDSAPNDRWMPMAYVTRMAARTSGESFDARPAVVHAPTASGPGDGMSVIFLFGFNPWDGTQRKFLELQMEKLQDDFETLRSAGYTVVVDTSACRKDFIAAAHGKLGDLPPACVYYSAHGLDSGALESCDELIVPSDVVSDEVPEGLRLVVFAACYVGSRARTWRRHFGGRPLVVGWGRPVSIHRAAEFLEARAETETDFDDLVRRFLIQKEPIPPEPIWGAELSPMASAFARQADMLPRAKSLAPHLGVLTEIKAEGPTAFLTVPTEMGRTQGVRIFLVDSAQPFMEGEALLGVESEVGEWSPVIETRSLLGTAAPPGFARVVIVRGSAEAPRIAVQGFIPANASEREAASLVHQVATVADRLEMRIFGTDTR